MTMTPCTQDETLTLTGIDAGLDSGTMTLHAGNREIPVCGSFTKRQAAIAPGRRSAELHERRQ